MTLNLSLPGNPRYQPKQLVPIFGYDNLYRAVARVEIATMKTLAEIGVIPPEDILYLTPEIEEKLLAITTTEVDKVEREVTGHDIRAWVVLAKVILHPQLGRWLHVPLTSYDPLETARALQFREGHEVVKSLTKKVMVAFAEQVRKYADTVQIGRTHGQHALPITVGFWLATVLSRIHSNLVSADNAALKLVGKISGAVGAYNAQVGLGISDRSIEIRGEKVLNFEDRVLEKLGLTAGPISTQILPPEPLADYLFSLLKLSAAIGQFGRDGRNLMRSEITEIVEPFEKDQVGSSTMAHKRNPVTLEGLESMWEKNQAEFVKVIRTLISDHQRDLTASAVYRDFPIIVVNVVHQLNTLLRKGKNDDRPFVSRLVVVEDALKRNFSMLGDSILAEPMYIALQMAGYQGDAHNLVSHHALARAKKDGVSIVEGTWRVLAEEFSDGTAGNIWNNITENTLGLLQNPGNYIGNASKKALQIADAAEEYLKN